MARGTFKQKRGGGRSFSRNLVLDENGTAVSTDKWSARGKKDDDGDDEDEDEDDEDEDKEEDEESEEESEEEVPATGSAQSELTRTERRELAKQRKQVAQSKKQPNGVDGAEVQDEDDELLANPNRNGVKSMTISDLSAPRQLSRKEREANEKKEAKERYWKLHEQGKTDEAKSDLARLAKIRAVREAAQAKRKAELEAKAAEIEAQRKVQGSRGKSRN